MTKFRKLEKREYQELFKQALFTTFFHNVEWHEFLEKEFKWLKFEYYIYKDEAVLPVARFKVFGKEKLVSLPFCEYGGPLPLMPIEDINFKDFNQNVEKEFDSLKIKFHPRIKAGESESDISTHWIENLKNASEQELLNSFRKTLRHEIQDAQKRGLEIKKCAHQKELKQFYNLYTANLRRKKTVPYPWGVIQFLCQNPSSELLMAFYSAQGRSASGGKVIGGCLFLNYNGFVHYFLSATDYKHRNLGVSYLIIWEKIKSLIGQDKTLDLGASPRGSALEIFKRGWGGTEYPIYQLGIKRTEESLRSLKLIRFIWGLLPNFAIKKLSSYLIKYRI